MGYRFIIFSKIGPEVQATLNLRVECMEYWIHLHAYSEIDYVQYTYMCSL